MKKEESKFSISENKLRARAKVAAADNTQQQPNVQ